MSLICFIIAWTYIRNTRISRQIVSKYSHAQKRDYLLEVLVRGFVSTKKYVGHRQCETSIIIIAILINNKNVISAISCCTGTSGPRRHLRCLHRARCLPLSNHRATNRTSKKGRGPERVRPAPERGCLPVVEGVAQLIPSSRSSCRTSVNAATTWSGWSTPT